MISASTTDMLHSMEHSHHSTPGPNQNSSSRILDIPCRVCGDYSSGKHYNIFACDGCAGFFKRSIRKNRKYICKGNVEGGCVIDKTHRNQCRACRLKKCQNVGMNRDAVQHERGPRNTTIRKALTSMFEQRQHRFLPYGTSSMPDQGALNLSVSRRHFPLMPQIELQQLQLVPGLPVFPAAPHPPRIPAIHSPVPHLSSPPMTPPLPTSSPKEICESAAKLLFFNVRWANTYPPFASLTSMNDQLVLLETSWKELFVLAASEYLHTLDLKPLIEECEAAKKDHSKTFTESVQNLQETLTQVKELRLDMYEYFFVRAMSLFQHTGHLDQQTHIQMVYNDIQQFLRRYMGGLRPFDLGRFDKVFGIMKRVGEVSDEVIAELFFKKAVDNTPMVKVIADIHRNK